MASDFKFAKNTIYNGELIRANTVRTLLDGVAADLEKRGFGNIVAPVTAPATEEEPVSKTAEEPVLQSTATKEKPSKSKNKRVK